MPAGRNRWRAPVPPPSFWRRSSRSLGNGKEWRKQSINGPWKRSVFAVCSKTGLDRSLCQLKRTARSDRFDQFMLFVQDRSRPVFVPSEMNCPVRSLRAVGAVCPISLFVSEAERERQELERAREEQEARKAAEQADQLMRDRAEELERMKREQQRLQDELDALKKAKVCCHVAGLWFSFHGPTLRCTT